MLPVMISEAVPLTVVAKILATKAVIAIVSGLLIEFVYVNLLKNKEKDMDIHVVCEEEHCRCEDGILKSALKHTIKILFYIFVISLVLNAVIGIIAVFCERSGGGRTTCGTCGADTKLCIFRSHYRVIFRRYHRSRCNDVRLVSQCRSGSFGIAPVKPQSERKCGN